MSKEMPYEGHLLFINKDEERFFVGLLEQLEWEEITLRQCAQQARTLLDLKILVGARMLPE